MRYAFLVDTYATERLKVVSTWSEFLDDDLAVRPHPSDTRGRSVHEHMVHQCVSEDFWFRTMLGIETSLPPTPSTETRLDFIKHYAEGSEHRLQALRTKSDEWWEQVVSFFEVERSRCWIMVRRIAHTSHHRGQQTTILRQLGRALHSNYGPTADTGGLMQDEAPTIYAYDSIESLMEAEATGGAKRALPGPGARPVTERPGTRPVTERPGPDKARED